MLTITRTKGESVTLFLPNGDTVRIIADVRPGKVRLLFAAPESVGIWRDEFLAHHPDIIQRNGQRELARS